MKRVREIYQDDPETLNYLEDQFDSFNRKIHNLTMNDPVKESLYLLYEEVMNNRNIYDTSYMRNRMTCDAFIRHKRSRPKNRWVNRITEWFE
jgi:hypothetical protein